MTPDELAKSGSEHGEQRALFAWARMAETYGFSAAWDDLSYSDLAHVQACHPIRPVPELHWMHAIPNGGQRDKATAGKLKVEGVKRGVLDIFLPLVMPAYGTEPCGYMQLDYCGLYIEMKRKQTEKEGKRKARIIDQTAGTTSRDQDAFILWAKRQGYAVGVYFDWRSAAKDIQAYVEKVRLHS